MSSVTSSIPALHRSNRGRPRSQTRQGCAKVLAGAVLLSLLANGPACSSGQSGRIRGPEAADVKGGKQQGEIDWSRTHLLILNGDPEERHKSNTAAAAKAGLANNAAGVYLAGLSGQIPGEVMRFKGDGIGLRKMLIRALENSKSGDTFFIYVTGHGESDHLITEGGRLLSHRSLLTILKVTCKERDIVFMSDACYSANFVSKLMTSNLMNVTAMSPGLEKETTSCSFFAQPFWHAVETRMDLDSDRRATIDEAFYYAMKRYRRLAPESMGTFRKSIPAVKSLAEVKDGIVLVTADWCTACSKMEPVFNKARLLSRGSLRFYRIHIDDSGHEGILPFTILIRDGKRIASTGGAMSIQGLRSWLRKNGVGTEDFRIPLRNLYDQGRFESIVYVSTWPEMVRELGIKRSVEVLTSQMGHADSKIRANALRILVSSWPEIREELGVKRSVEFLASQIGHADNYTRSKVLMMLEEASVEHDIDGIPAVRDGMTKLLHDDNDTIRIKAISWFISHAISEDPDSLMPVVDTELSPRNWPVKVSDLEKTKHMVLSSLPQIPAVVWKYHHEEGLAFRRALVNALRRRPAGIMPHIIRFIEVDGQFAYRSPMAMILFESTSRNPERIVPHLSPLAGSNIGGVRTVATMMLFRAAMRIRDGRQKEVVALLKSLLSDRNLEVRGYAAEGMLVAAVRFDVGADQGIVRDLGKLLDEPDIKLAHTAAQALKEIGKRHPSKVKGYSDRIAKIAKKAESAHKEATEILIKEILRKKEQGE